MNLFEGLQLVGIIAEAALVALVLNKNIYRTFPVFCSYLVWDLADNIALVFVSHLSPMIYFRSYLAAVAIDSVFMYGVLVEIAWSVLRPYRSALPRGAVAVVAFMIGAVGAVVWPFAHSAAYAHYGTYSRLLIHLQQTSSVMRVIFFLTLAGCSQLLSISWRDRELQIATGLGLYSLVSPIASILQAGQSVGPTYVFLDQLVVVSTVCGYVYWIYSFAQEAYPRQDFTPQMQDMLLSVAGAARSIRLSLTEQGTANR